MLFKAKPHDTTHGCIKNTMHYAPMQIISGSLENTFKINIKSIIVRATKGIKIYAVVPKRILSISNTVHIYLQKLHFIGMDYIPSLY